MSIFRRGQKSGSAVAEPVDERSRSSGELFEEIDELTARNLESRDPELERRIRHLRHLAGMRLLDEAPADPITCPPPREALKSSRSCRRCRRRSSTRRSFCGRRSSTGGCLLVRGPDAARRGASPRRRDRPRLRGPQGAPGGRTPPPGYYEEIAPEPGFSVIEPRSGSRTGGACSPSTPRGAVRLPQRLREGRPAEVIADYLGERPALSARSPPCASRPPTCPANGTRTARFLGDVRAHERLALAVSLRRRRPGTRPRSPAASIDFVARGARMRSSTGPPPRSVAEEAAGERGSMRPIFEPGDALLFDDLFLHQTAADPRCRTPLRDRELVLRALALPRRIRSDRFLRAGPALSADSGTRR